MSFKYKGELIAGSGGGSSEEVYSTNEVRIGTWIDGKPLYRKVYKFTTPSTEGKHDLGKCDEATEVVKVDGIVEEKDSYIPIPRYWDSDTYFSYIVCKNSGAHPLQFRISFKGSAHYGCPIWFIVTYTKTTDQATIQLQESTTQFESPSVTIPDYTTATSASIADII